jgi:MFS family permease
MIVACALFMENMDATVIATSLPVIARAFGESPLRLNLAITAHLPSVGIFLPLSGWLADKLGARTVFSSAIVVFTLGSVGCALVDSLPQLVAARALEGVGGAMMVPVGRLVVLRSIPKAELVAAMAYLTVPALIGPAIGPPLGGFIATCGSWRWIFLIDISIGVLGLVLSHCYIENVRESRSPAARPHRLRDRRRGPRRHDVRLREHRPRRSAERHHRRPSASAPPCSRTRSCARCSWRPTDSSIRRPR